jgi:hypothetical protein
MSGAYTDYPVSPLASLAKLIATGYKLYNYSQTQKQDELERQRKEQEARIEAERQAREYDQTQAAQALQMGQWAQTGQGWQMLQQPEYQEAFRRAGGVLPIQSQQIQGQGVNPTGPMPLSALSNATVQNTYKLPDKPEDLWTVEEWYAKNGLAMPDEAKKYAKVPMQKALQYKLVDLTPPDPDAELAKRFKLTGLLTDPDAKAAAEADPLINRALIDMGIPTTGTATPDGQVLLEPAWNVPEPEAVPWEDQPFTGEAPPQFKGITNGQAVKLGILKPPEEPKTLTRAETPVNKLYTPEQLQQMGVPQILWDQPAGKAIEASPVLAEAEGFKPQTPDNTKAFQDAREDLDGLTTKLADAVANGDEVNAIRYWGQFKARRAKYAAAMPEIDTLFPLDSIETVRQNAVTVKTEKAQAKIGVDAGERLQRMRVEAYEKANRLGVNALNPGQRLLINADDNLLQTAIGLAQRDPVVQFLAMQSIGGPQGQEKYNKALDTAVGKYLTQLQNGSGLNTIPTPQPGATPAPTPKPTPSPQGAQQPGLLKGTKPAPAKGKDARTPAEKQKRTDAVRQIIGQAKAAIGAKKLTKQQALQLFMQESRWYDAAEIDWVKREINKMK